MIFLKNTCEHTYRRDSVKITDSRYIIKRVATNTNSKEIVDFYEKQQRKLKKKYEDISTQMMTDVMIYLKSVIFTGSL